MTTPILKLCGVATDVAGASLLRGIDLEVERGEVVAMVGPSGGGKTSLLRALNYLTPFTAGSIEVAGLRLTPGMSERRDAALLRQVRVKVGMVFQHFNLFPHLSVAENIAAAPQRVLGLSPDAASARADELLQQVGLQAHASAYPRSLSGGQQQRVAIARALAMQPELLLFDEPTSALDAYLVGEVVALLKDVAAGGQTMLLVSHDLKVVRRVAQRVIVLAAGRVVEDGDVQAVLERPQHAVTQQLVEAANYGGNPSSLAEANAAKGSA